MERRLPVSVGRDHSDVERLDQVLEEGTKANYDFHAVPVVRPGPMPDNLEDGVLERPSPFLRTDFLLKTSEWSSLVVAKISDWIDLDSDDQRIRLRSEKALLQELDFAIHLGLPAILVPLRSKKCANLARFLNEHLFLGPTQQLWVHVRMRSPSPKLKNASAFNGHAPDDAHFPSLGSLIKEAKNDAALPMDTNGASDGSGVAPAAPGSTDDDEVCATSLSKSVVKEPVKLDVAVEEDDDQEDPDQDPWEWFNTFRTLCDTSRRVSVCLEITADLPSESRISRWLGEPVKCTMLPTNIFLTNRTGFPVLSRPHQSLIRRLIRQQTQFLITGPTSIFDKSEICFYQYLDYLVSTVSDDCDGVDKFAKGYEDYLQAPLQPLMDNLESQTYEVFEKDPVKYVTYEAAIRDALVDRVPEPEKEQGYQVLMVVGAGRGPLVRAALKAAKTVERRVRVYAVEKNPNALITLKTLKREIWNEDDVIIVHHDMRTWEAPEKADILVSELLGSFSDNELSPECLDGAQKFLKRDGISIPSEYTSFVAPLQSSKLFNEARANKEREKHPLANVETPYVVRLHNCAVLAKPQPLFRFEHPNWGRIDNSRYGQVEFRLGPQSVLHGFAGYFHSVLYKNHVLSIVPETYSTGMFSWFPIYFPIREPILLPAGSKLDLHFWRRVDAQKVWYEWAVTKPVPIPIHNPKARSYWIGL